MFRLSSRHCGLVPMFLLDTGSWLTDWLGLATTEQQEIKYGRTRETGIYLLILLLFIILFNYNPSRILVDMIRMAAFSATNQTTMCIGYVVDAVLLSHSLSHSVVFGKTSVFWQNPVKNIMLGLYQKAVNYDTRTFITLRVATAQAPRN